MLLLWIIGRVVDSRPKGRGFEPHRRHCVVSLSKNINPSLVLVQPKKNRPFIIERLLMGRKESNQTNKTNKQIIHVISFVCLLCFCARLIIVALWSPAGKGLSSWLSFVMSNCEFVTFPLVSWVRCGTRLYRSPDLCLLYYLEWHEPVLHRLL